MIALLAVMLSAMDDGPPRQAQPAAWRLSAPELSCLCGSGAGQLAARTRQLNDCFPWRVVLPLAWPESRHEKTAEPS